MILFVNILLCFDFDLIKVPRIEWFKKKSSNILITGDTRFIGKYVTELLLENN